MATQTVPAGWLVQGEVSWLADRLAGEETQPSVTTAKEKL